MTRPPHRPVFMSSSIMARMKLGGAVVDPVLSEGFSPAVVSCVSFEFFMVFPQEIVRISKQVAKTCRKNYNYNKFKVIAIKLKTGPAGG